jgi:phytoene dehydrogenase-like protein
MEGTASVVGSGPNGLAAAVVLARAGLDVTVWEAADHLGGATRSTNSLDPDAVTDLGSAVHPFGVASPLFNRLPLERHGLHWVHPQTPLAHPLEGRPAALLEHSLPATAQALGLDGRAWTAVHRGVVNRWEAVVEGAMGPLLRVPGHPLAMGAFGARAVWSAVALARAAFRGAPARALFAGSAAHAVLPLTRPLTAAFGTLFGAAAHATGWPVARGGSQAIADALAADLVEHGGRVRTGTPVTDLAQVRPADLILLDLTPRQVLALAGGCLPPRYARSLARWRYGTAVYKVDYLLDGPAPWSDARVQRAGTVHVGGTLAEVASAEADVYAGRHPDRPFVLVAQQSSVDPTRVLDGRQVLWAYSHTPHASDVSIGARIDAQIERFAPGFRDRILNRIETTPADLERANSNLVGGDIGGGAMDGLQQVFRPIRRAVPYATPLEGVFLCSSSTPPGGGVHGMCGYHAARVALDSLLVRRRRGSPAAGSRGRP